MRVFTPRRFFPFFILCLVFSAPTVLRGQTDNTAATVLDGHLQRHVITAHSANQVLTFENLIVGETFSLIVPEDPALNGCLPEIVATDANTKILEYDAAVRQLKFVVTASTMSFQLNYPCSWEADNPPRHYVSMVCNTCLKKSFAEYMKSLAVLEVSPGGSAEDLIKEVLIGGNCFDVTNVTFQGNGSQIGTFANGTTNIGFDHGMIMATGNCSVAVGPNNTDNASAGFGNATPDADLSQLSGSGSLYDLASIEFDFTPTKTPLTFEYVFGSEEYCEYVGSQFNDAFGFFISGPGITGPFGGAANIAALGPGNYVAINNVNHISNAGLYVNNQPASSGNLCGQQPANGPAVNEVQFDGFTKRLTAVAPVIPCSTYHIKLKIADVGDGIFDSGVFLRAGSFSGSGAASVEWLVNDQPDVTDVYEGCGTVKLVFKRVGGNINSNYTVSYTISGTATPGADYSPIPAVVVIPAGQTQVVINVNIVNDLIAEGAETIVIRLTNPCSCLEPEITLTIHDLLPLSAVADTVVICGSGVGTVTVTPTDGVPPYSYSWQGGGNTDTKSQFVAVSTNIRVTVTDNCGKTFVATARINVKAPPVAQLLPPAPQICPGQSALIRVNFVGTGPFTLNYTQSGNLQPPIEGITENPFFLEVNEPGLYQIANVIDSDGCVGNGQGALLVTQSSLTLNGTVTNPTCNNSSNGAIQTSVTGGQGPYTYTWQGPQNLPNLPFQNNLQGGTYLVTVTDGFGCTSQQQFNVVAPPAIDPVVANVQGATCANPTGGSIDLTVTGGSPNYTYNWTGGQTVQDPQNLAPGNYTVTVTDSKGCTKTTTATVPGNFTPPDVVAAAPDPLTCVVTSVSLNGNGSSSGPNFTYNWTASGGGNIVSGGNTLTPVVNQPGTYTLVVTNTANGCTAAQSTQVVGDNVLPTANGGPDQTLTCVLTNATLDGSGSSGGANFTYQWTATNGGTIVSGGTTLNPLVSSTGTYTLLVTNTANGCTKTDVVLVNSNTTPPVAVIGAPALLTCTNTTVTLNGSGSTPAGSLGFSWSTNNGNIQSGQASANAVVSEPGNYTLVVTNTINGCTNSTTATVAQDNSVPVAEADVNGLLNCNTTQLTISGTGSSSGSNFTYTWSSTPGGSFVSGQNTLNPVVNAPATYTLLVTNTTNQCTATASVLITQDIAAPAANAGTPATLTCVVTSHTLGDPNAPVGPNLSYVWTTTGGNIVSGGNTPTPTVNQPGTYNLVVTNATNGCSSTASIAIPQNITNPTATVAPGGELNCTSPVVQLNGTGSSTGPNFTYEWTSSTGGGIGAGGNTLNPTVTAAGIYTLTVTNNVNGCTSTASATVTSNANLPTAIATPSGILTCAVPQVTLNANGSSSGPGYTYQWGTINGQIVSGQGTLLLTVGQPGQYTLLVTNTANNCTATFSIQVEADKVAPTASAGTSQTLLCTQPSMTLDGSGSSTGPQFSYQWTALSGGNFTSPTNILNPTVNAPGTYQILVTNTQNGCTSTAQVNILQDADEPIVQIATPNILNCVTGQVTLNGNGSTTGANISYAWTGPGIVSGNTTLNPVVNQPGSYNLVITNSANGCTSDMAVTVNQDITPPPADAGPDKVLNCFNPQLQLGGTGNPSGPNYTFSWTGAGILSGGTTGSPVIDQGGTYNLLVTNTTNGCTTTDEVLVTMDFAQPNVNAGNTFQLTCVANTYTLDATASTGPEFTYQWTTNTGNFITPTNILNPTVDGAGNYFLLVTNTINGCTATSTVLITQAADVPIAVANSAPQLTCAVTSITLSGAGSSAGPEFSYLWTATGGGNITGGNVTLSPTIDAPGTYVLAVTNTTNNCTASSSVLVTQNINPPVMDAGPSPTLTCTVLSVNLAGTVSSNGNFTYSWSASNGGNITSGANTLAPTVNATGTYSLVVTNTLNGCTSTDATSVSADQEQPNVFIAQPSTLTCAVQQTILDATASSTGAAFTYQWSTTGGNFVNQTNPLQPVVNQPGNYTLLITDTSNGCTQTYSTEVAQNVQNPTAHAGTDGLLTCAVTSLQLNGTGSSQNGNYFYQWTTANGQILVGANGLNPTIVAGGTYVLVVVNEDNGCSASDEVLVNVNTTPPVAAIATPSLITCVQPQVTLNGSGSQGGPNISYIWTTLNGNIVGGETTNSATVSASGTYTLTVLNDATGCTNTATVTVNDNIVLPIAEAGPPFTLTCTVEQVTLQGTASTGSIYSYTWSTQGGQFVSGNSSLTPVVNQAGVYTLTVANTTTGCTQTDQVQVFLETNMPTDFIFDLKNPSCKDNDGIITFGQVAGGIGPFTYSINNGQSFFAQTDFQKITPGTYDLWIQDANGCEFHKTLNVPKAPDPAVSLAPDFKIALGESLKIEATLPAGYPLALIDTVIWTPIDGLTFDGNSILNLLSPTAQPFKPTQYTVTIISIDGCEASDRTVVRVDNQPHIYIPNVFSPWKEDGDNDVVYIFAKGDQVVQVKTFQIFDRWGAMVFQKQNFLPNDPAYGWNGRYRGKLMTPAVFAYYAEIELIDGRVLLYKGDVTLLR
ncbi:MAG: choice-of-anchor L domain-containing protein [Saprospiraceae bacterium]|nr:choice-of-anchor L domain-containing protein [Saprospiraceae bacterium]